VAARPSLRGMGVAALVFALAMLTLCICNPAASSTTQQARVQDVGQSLHLLEQGRLLETEGDHEAALRHYQASVYSSSRNAEAAHAVYVQANKLTVSGKFTRAIAVLTHLVKHSQHYSLEVLYLLGVSYSALGDVEEAATYYRQTLHHDPLHSNARINLAVLHHYHGSLEEAIREYENGLLYLGGYTFAVRRAAGFPESTGGDGYMLPQERMLRLNMAAAYLQQGDFGAARKRLLHLLADLAHVEGVVCEGKGEGQSSWMQSKAAHGVDDEDKGKVQVKLVSLERAAELEKFSSGYAAVHAHLQLELHTLYSTCEELRADIGAATSHILVIQRATCDWEQREALEGFLLQETLRAVREGGRNMEVKLLPFDALLVPYVAQSTIRSIAEAYVAWRAGSGATEAPGLTADAQLRLGFLSYDFNNHPTAHLVEALFVVIAQQRELLAQRLPAHPIYKRVRTFLYSYGKDDSSDYRKQLMRLADRFRDIISLSYEDASRNITADSVDVLLDMQVHTLGNKLKILAGRPAPIQTNYLVYPATSGAMFLDSLVADRVVVPAEHAVQYSESLLLLPPSYQISYYTRHDSAELQEILAAYRLPPHTAVSSTVVEAATVRGLKQRLRLLHGLPLHASAVFCNFNKIDKLDLQTLNVWMNILRGVPGSVLWLLHASVRTDKLGDSDRENKQPQNDEVIINIRNACAAAGVSHKRIIFASRVSKSQHLARQLAADLFLDSFVYGAHSTATDALRGGLPVLTVIGGAFPARVGLSLYESLCPGTTSSVSNINTDHANKLAVQKEEDRLVCSHMMRTSVKDFEQFAIHVVTKQPELLIKMSRVLARAVVDNQGIFNIETSTRAFLRGIEALKEARFLQKAQRKNRLRDAGNDDKVQEKKRKYSVFMSE